MPSPRHDQREIVQRTGELAHDLGQRRAVDLPSPDMARASTLWLAGDSLSMAGETPWASRSRTITAASVASVIAAGVMSRICPARFPRHGSASVPSSLTQSLPRMFRVPSWGPPEMLEEGFDRGHRNSANSDGHCSPLAPLTIRWAPAAAMAARKSPVGPAAGARHASGSRTAASSASSPRPAAISRKTNVWRAGQHVVGIGRQRRAGDRQARVHSPARLWAKAVIVRTSDAPGAVERARSASRHLGFRSALSQFARGVGGSRFPRRGGFARSRRRRRSPCPDLPALTCGGREAWGVAGSGPSGATAGRQQHRGEGQGKRQKGAGYTANGSVSMLHKKTARHRA